MQIKLGQRVTNFDKRILASATVLVLLLAAGILIFFWVGRAEAGPPPPFHVALTGLPLEGDSSCATPDFNTIQDAVNAIGTTVQPGNTVIVCKGIYNESVTIKNKNGHTHLGAA